MSWRNVNLIFQREVRDQLRDRRTLFMVAVLPILLYPALGVGLVQMTLTFSEQLRRVIVIGVDELPSPPLIVNDEFDPRYFASPGDVEKLELVTDDRESLDRIDNPDERARVEQFLEEFKRRNERIQRLAEVQNRLIELPSNAPDVESLRDEERTLRRELELWFSQAPAQVFAIFPENFQEQYEQVSQLLASASMDSVASVRLPRPIILHNSADEKSEIAYQRLQTALRNWEDTLLQERLQQAQLPIDLVQPIRMTAVDLAEPGQLAANVWSKIFPTLLVIMAVTGAFYPAIDLGAGEKERGTMETLLISPATRTEIVFGKFFTVMLFSISTALLNLASMGFTGRHILSSVGTARSSPMLDLSFPPLTSLIWVVLLAIPIAALFSALSLSLAMFARSSKEGQYYLTPLLLVTMGITIFCLNPGIELTPYYSVLPVAGPALLLKALLLGGTSTVPVGLYAVPVLVASCAYSLLALWWAVDQFQREDILFREAERFDLRLWVCHLLREKEPTPSFSEAIVGFVLIALTQFLFLTWMQGSPELINRPERMATTQLIYLVATVGVPPLMMAMILTARPRLTLKLLLPNGRFLLAGIVLAITLQPLAVELLAHLKGFFPPPPPGAEKVMQAMAAETVPLWLSLAAFALAPAICEELAFRGFILSGLQRSRHRWLPIVISALLFGIIHMIPTQQFNASLLGLVLGLLAVRSESLLPGVVFHAIFNGTQVWMSRLQPSDFQRPGISPFVTMDDSGPIPEMHFTTLTLVICGVISALLIVWLMNTHTRTGRNPAVQCGGDSSP